MWDWGGGGDSSAIFGQISRMDTHIKKLKMTILVVILGYDK